MKKVIFIALLTMAVVMLCSCGTVHFDSKVSKEDKAALQKIVSSIPAHATSGWELEVVTNTFDSCSGTHVSVSGKTAKMSVKYGVLANDAGHAVGHMLAEDNSVADDSAWLSCYLDEAANFVWCRTQAKKKFTSAPEEYFACIVENILAGEELGRCPRSYEYARALLNSAG